MAVPGLSLPSGGAADVRVGLDVFPDDQAQPNGGGIDRSSSRRTRSLASRVFGSCSTASNDGPITEGDPAAEILLAASLDAIDPIRTNAGPPRPDLDLDTAGTELLFVQDIPVPTSVVTGVGRPESRARAAGAGSGPRTFPVAQYDHRSTNGIAGGSAIVEREDLSDLASFDGGRRVPFVEVRIRHDGVDTTFRPLVREASGNAGLSRTDPRWGTGPTGGLFILDKRDRWVRKAVDGADFLRWQASLP